jgi:hypothetical protein
MQSNSLAITLFLVCGLAHVTYAQSVEKLIEESDPAVQTQIQRVIDALQKPSVDARSDIDVCRELQTLKKLSPNNNRLVKQLAIFVATMKSAEDIESADAQASIMQAILQVLDFPPRIPIRVLAPYLDADNRQLRDSVRRWFTFHDGAAGGVDGAPPISPVKYEDYVEYVESKVTRKEDVPTPFTKYIFEGSPGRALLVFAFANSPNIHIVTPQQKLAAVVQAEKAKLREIELAEHIVSNAIWLNKNGFADRFQQARPEANEQSDKLAKGEWWAKLYVVYTMRQNPSLLKAQTLQKLSEDHNELVQEVAKSAGS